MSGHARIRIRLPAPAAADYDVVIGAGLLDRLPDLLPPALSGRRVAVVADANVAGAHGERVRSALARAGHPASLFAFPAGEASKSRETWASLTDSLLAAGYGRDSAVVAVGGGVAGDLAGFVAATFMRGVPVVQVPTSLLAMVDAAIGGKTGVDLPAGKNLVGAYHQPSLVVMDPETLRTLPEAELRAGLAEAVKHGAIADADYLDAIVENAGPLLGRETRRLEALIETSVRIKAGVVREDPFETGRRAVLNFGHTIAHALEAESAFRVPHGFAVAIGMIAEAAAGEMAGVTRPGTARRLEAALEPLGLPVALPSGTRVPEVLERARADKKARSGETRYALLERIGEVARGPAGEWTLPLPDDLVAGALERLRG